MSRKTAARIIVGLSGGVDSAVAALELRRQGHDVEGLFMANWHDPDPDADCSTARDYQDARAVCQELGIVLHRVDFSAQYRQQVFEIFLRELRAGRTPNPDVLCNREIKFGVCLDYVRRLGAERFATGHYARLVQGAHGIELHKAVDANKDQSYFLHAVERAHLAQALFPLGDLTKAEVREHARRAGLPVFDKPDSTGICFIGERPFAAFLAHWLEDAPGPIVSDTGETLGRHRGLHRYTLGQRGGIGIGGLAGHAESAWFVAAKERAGNRLVVVQGGDHPLLWSTACTVADCHWLTDRTPPWGPETVRGLGVKLRYRQNDQGISDIVQACDAWRLEFAAAQRAVTPGQYAVLYRGTRCLGGGVIAATTSVTECADPAAIMPTSRNPIPASVEPFR